MAKTVALLLMTLAIVACSANPITTASPSASPAATASPTPLSSIGPTNRPSPVVTQPTPSATPESSPSPTGWHWDVAGSIPTDGAQNLVLVAFEGGYAAFTRFWMFEVAPAVWTSADGAAWERANVPDAAQVSCTVDQDFIIDIHDLYYAAVRFGSGLVIVGSEIEPNEYGVCTRRAVALVSADGRTWQRSDPFAFDARLSVATAIWIADGRIETLVETVTPQGVDFSVWASTGGLHWSRSAVLDLPPKINNFASAVAAVDGKRLLSFVHRKGVPEAGNLSVSDATLLVSDDGNGWVVLDSFPATPDFTYVKPAIGPVRDGDTWLVVVERIKDPLTTTVWQSADLSSWQQAVFPAWLGQLIATGDGFLAIGADAQWVSGNAIDWMQLEDSIGGDDLLDYVIDGRAGTLGVGWAGVQDAQETTVWRLVP